MRNILRANKKLELLFLQGCESLGIGLEAQRRASEFGLTNLHIVCNATKVHDGACCITGPEFYKGLERTKVCRSQLALDLLQLP